MRMKFITILSLLTPLLLSADTGQFVRIELQGGKRILTLAEVKVIAGGKNVAPAGKASQSSVASGGVPARAIDGKTDASYESNGLTHTNEQKDPWWELDLGKPVAIDQIEIYNRGDGLEDRLEAFTLSVLDAQRKEVFKREDVGTPREVVRFEIKEKGKAVYLDRKGKVQAAVPPPVTIPAGYKDPAPFAFMENDVVAV
ncbi:MAG: hypothetical protein ACI9QL_004832, partial [Candidatus Omnitrophota bacterium]